MQQQLPPQPMPAPAPKKRRHVGLIAVGSVIGFLGLVGGCGTLIAGGSDTGTHVAASTPTAATGEQTAEPTAEETTEPEATASPDGTFSGSCDYQLFPDILTGDVDVENTGNVGVVVDVRISWPQQGYGPIKMHRQVKVGYGKTKTVRFHRSASTSEIERLQSWQEGHGYADGCKYHGAMVRTYGQVH